MNSQPKFKLEVQISAHDISRSALLQQLIKNDKCNLRQTKRQIGLFLQRLSAPCEIYWYRFRALSLEDQEIVAALAEMHGADRLIIESGFELKLGRYSLKYVQRLRFLPWDGRPTGLVEPEICLEGFGYRARLTTTTQVFLLRLLLLLGLALAYAVLFGMLLYGLAVGLLLQELPAETLVLATKQPLVGLALLCFLMGVAGILGRAVRFVLKSAM